MDKTRETRRSTTSMAASNGLTKQRQRTSENIRGKMHHEVATGRDRQQKKDRDPESLNRSKRRRSERFTPRNEKDVVEDSSDDSMEDDTVHHYHQGKSLPSGRVPRHAASSKVADEMIGVLIPRKARSACVKRSHVCRTSSGSGGGGFGEDRRRPGSHSFEVVSPSSSTVSVKHNKTNVNISKSRIPRPPKSSGTVEDDLEIEIAEVLSGLKKQPHNSKREHHSESSLKSSVVKDVNRLKTEGEDSSVGVYIRSEANIDKSTNGTKTSSAASDIQREEETLSILDGVQENHRLNSRDSAPPKGLSESTQLDKNRDESHCSSKLEIDLMAPPTMPSSPGRVSLLPLVSDLCKRDSIIKNEMIPEEVKQKKNEKSEWLNFDMERPNQETCRNSILRLQNLEWSQPQQAKSVLAQKSSVLPLPLAEVSSPSRLPSQGCALIQTSKAMDGSNISSTLVQDAPFSASQPRPKRCATHFFIARNIQLHQHFVKTNHLSTPYKGSIYLKGGDLKLAAGNPSLQGSSPILSLSSQANYVMANNISAPKDRASESSHIASTGQKKPPLASNSIVPAPAYIFPTNHHLQPVMVLSKSSHPAKIPRVGVGSASVNFSNPNSSATEASSPYFTVLPNNTYSFQLSSTVRGGTPSQALPYFYGSFYSPQMFQQPFHLFQRQSQAQMESKTSSSSASFHRQPQLQVSVNSLSSQANVQHHRQQLNNSEAKSAGDNSDSSGSHTQKGTPYGQIMTVPVQPQNFSMSFASFPGCAPPANLNFSSSGYHMVSVPPVAHQKNHQASESKSGGGSCSSNAEDPNKTIPGKPPTMMNGQTLVFDNPSRTLNFVSGTWSLAATTVNGDPSMSTHHLTQRQQQSGRIKMMSHAQADSVSHTSSQRKIPATSSLTSCNSLNPKQFQSQQQIRTHGQTQISFAAPSQVQSSQGQQGRSGGASYSVTGSASQSKAANSKAINSKALSFSPGPTSSPQAQEQTENSVTGSTQKTSPVCGRTVPSIITSCPGHLSELKF